MLYSLLSFFSLHYFFGNYWVSFITAFVVLIIENTKIIKNNCNCNSEKPQKDV